MIFTVNRCIPRLVITFKNGFNLFHLLNMGNKLMPKRDWLMGVKPGIEILNNHLPEYRMAIVNLNPGETSEAA